MCGTWIDKTVSLFQDPPSFRGPPRDEYLQEVGRGLVIPCEANGDPAPNITWSKVNRETVNPLRHT